ncbi:MAG: hypothetical protein QOF59_2418 [Actinomycetota bacterium]|nr:hypothetical protein [Actinomycetota bacterium]
MEHLVEYYRRSYPEAIGAGGAPSARRAAMLDGLRVVSRSSMIRHLFVMVGS